MTVLSPSDLPRRSELGAAAPLAGRPVASLSCPSCHGENGERLSVLHARRKANAPYAVPPQRAHGARRLGLGALLSLVPVLLHSGWWMGGTLLLGSAALSMRPIERRHHAQALSTWSRTCVCMDCGASWQSEDLESVPSSPASQASVHMAPRCPSAQG